MARERKPEQTQQGKLIPGATRGVIEDGAVERVIFSDCGGGQIDSQFRNLAADIRRKSIAVWTRPEVVLVGVRIAADGLKDLRNSARRTLAAQVNHKLRVIAEPSTVRNAWTRKDRWQVTVDAPTDGLMDRVLDCAFRFGGDPRMDSENPAPVERSG